MISAINSTYDKLKTNMQCIPYKTSDYTVTTILTESDYVQQCYCYLLGEDTIKGSSSYQAVCQDYLDNKDLAVAQSIIAAIILAIL